MAGLCTQRCSEDHRCRSYRYNTKTKTCSTYGGGFSVPTKTLNNVTEEDGSRLYASCGSASFGMKCVTSSNCAFGNSTCVDDTCTCVTGTSYDVTTGDCLIRCPVYGSDFIAYDGCGLSFCNNKTMTVSTMQACFAECKAETGFVCISVEYSQVDGTCHLCDTPALEFPEEYHEFGTSVSIDWTLAVRHCAF
ncbi:uncharacterized protein [Haliotis asinina]|uniref:uncharacterized protein n=1 Tax=Haliotis asinina TaxID=109174 RepID=UPI0035319C42